MIPKIRLMPLAIRSSSRPYCTAFRHWTRKVARSTGESGAGCLEGVEHAHAGRREVAHVARGHSKAVRGRGGCNQQVGALVAEFGREPAPAPRDLGCDGQPPIAVEA